MCKFFFQNTATDTLNDLFTRRQQKKRQKFNPELRAFAITLQYYSRKAYNYVRKSFSNLLPHPETLTKWYQVVGGGPGFTQEALLALEEKAKSSPVILNITIDEMSIRDHIHFDGNRFHGFVDLGINTDESNEDENAPHAKYAWVFMAVSLNDTWKVPIGYFLISSLAAAERANILTICINSIYKTGAHVYGITFDGAAVNIAMANALGASFDEKDFRPYINLPSIANKVLRYIFEFYIFFMKGIASVYCKSESCFRNTWHFLCSIEVKNVCFQNITMSTIRGLVMGILRWCFYSETTDLT